MREGFIRAELTWWKTNVKLVNNYKFAILFYFTLII